MKLDNEVYAQYTLQFNDKKWFMSSKMILKLKWINCFKFTLKLRVKYIYMYTG